jgi:type IV pilus assembly protein PilX
MSRQIPNRAGTRRRQQGVALAVVLILLLVMTMLAVASLRGVLLEERMSASMMDRSLSFQAAEAALREGEALAATKPPVPAAGCSNGVCAIAMPVDAPRWLDAAVWAGAREAQVQLGALTARPKYIVELLADNVPAKGSCTSSEDVSPDAACTGTEHRYRITARSEAQGRAVVMLQSNYAVP